MDKIRAKYDAILEKQGSHIDISQMGIDNLIVDEAHLFKNLAFETSMEKLQGLVTNKALIALEICLLKRATCIKTIRKSCF
ncbi:hypothetical protein BTM110_15060 [Helicobacter pylori]